jgi:hypothetical protein
VAVVASLVVAVAGLGASADRGQRPRPQPALITFNTRFEGAALGQAESLGSNHFRCHVAGQHDEHGRNRQASWYAFRLEGAKDQEITLTLTGFVGEYNGRPGACPMNADTIPVFSYDAEHWQHFTAMRWDEEKKEATLSFRPAQHTIWIAHVPPYPTSRLHRLLTEVNHHPQAVVQVIGQSVQGRALHLVTVTNPAVPDTRKKTVWLIARQHAWEAPTSLVMEGALRFLTSEDPRAALLRDRFVCQFVPMMDPDGSANGQVRFNANGYDLNRHWDEVDLRQKEWLRRLPEVWYVKKALVDWRAAGRPLDLVLNLHNTESAEFLETQADNDAPRALLARLSERLIAATSFDPSRPPTVSSEPDSTTNWLWREHGIPVILMEQRIGRSPKLGRQPTVEDRLEFGKQLIAAMAAAVGAVAPDAP